MTQKGYIVFSIVTGLLQEAALAAVVLWLLPLLGVNIPIWGLILLMAAYGVKEGITYRIGARALGRKPIVSLEAMVGCRGEAATPLAPNGYVQVQGELWWALSTGGANIRKGDEIIVVEVKRLTLLVAPLSNNIDIREGGAKE